MVHDIPQLASFYASPLGQQVRADLAVALSPYYRFAQGKSVVGFGFATPYLTPFMAKAARCFALMPARQGAFAWPHPDHVATALVEEENLPLPDASIDCFLLVHALEEVKNAAQTLRELWRVLVPGGQLIMIVPNRYGLWAWADHAVFGGTHSYSRRQLQSLLHEEDFSPLALYAALHFWPRKDWQIKHHSRLYERFARHVIPSLGGVWVVQAQKQYRQGISVMQRRSKPVFIPILPAPKNASAMSENRFTASRIYSIFGA